MRPALAVLLSPALPPLLPPLQPLLALVAAVVTSAAMVGAPTPLSAAPAPAPPPAVPGLTAAAAASGDPETASTRWVWPINGPHVVLARFDPPGTRYGPGHRGVDLAAEVGQVILAPAAGQVSFAGMVAGRPVLVVTHGNGLRSTFEPVLGQADVGSVVARGSPVGRVASAGDLGHCRQSCVHWGVLRGTTYLDPMAMLSRRVVLLPL